MEKEYYTSDFVLGNPSRDYNPFKKYDEQIAKYKELKAGLEEFYNHPAQTKEMKLKIADVQFELDHYISEFEKMRYKRYEEGIYRQELYSNGKTLDRFIKRVEGNSCDECIFNNRPCLQIRSHYGCYTTPEHSVNNELENGELVKTGHFIEIEPIK